MTVAYDTQRSAFHRRVQWCVEIDIDRCSRTYGTSPCLASDLGDGNRCWYSWPTCQYPTAFNRGTRTYRFCLNAVPWPDPANPAYPMLKSFIAAPQEIKPDKIATYPEKLTFTFLLDALPLPPDIDKGAGKYNTVPVGEFWANLIARSPNMLNRPIRVKRGFYVEGGSFALSDFTQLGPDYKIKSFGIEKGLLRVEAESLQSSLDKASIPWAISEDNTLQVDLTDVGTTVYVRDASEFPNPTAYSRNEIYVKIEDEVLLVSSRSTVSNTLTVQRGRCGTTAVAHTARATDGTLDKKVSHVVFFGTDNGSSAPDGRAAPDVLRDLLEWAGVTSASVNSTSFDAVKNTEWPNPDVLAFLEKSEKVSKHFQVIRDMRGILTFIGSDGKFNATCFAPSTAPAGSITDEQLIGGVSKYAVDEEKRLTRVSFWFDPNVEQAVQSRDFLRCVLVIDTNLESANEYGDSKSRVVTDAWLDPDLPGSDIRNLARKLITRNRRGQRLLGFQLELVDGDYWVGDLVLLSSRYVTDANGVAVERPYLLLSRKEVNEHVIEYQGIDLEHTGRFCRIAPDTATDDYDSATDEERARYGYWGSTTYNRVGAAQSQGTVLW